MGDGRPEITCEAIRSDLLGKQTRSSVAVYLRSPISHLPSRFTQQLKRSVISGLSRRELSYCASDREGGILRVQRGRCHHAAPSRSGRMVPILPGNRERSAKGNACIHSLQPPATKRVEPSGELTIPRSGAGSKIGNQRVLAALPPRSFEHGAENAGDIYNNPGVSRARNRESGIGNRESGIGNLES